MALVDYGNEMIGRLPKRNPVHEDGNEGNILLKDVFGLALEKIEEDLFSTSDMRFLENAEGKYLDYWGDILGIKRSLGTSKQNILISDPNNSHWLNIATGGDYIGDITGLGPVNGAVADITTDWAKEGYRSFMLKFGYVNNEAVYFLPTNYIPLVGGFRDVRMTIKGMPTQHNYVPMNVATGTDALQNVNGFSTFGASGKVNIGSSTEQKFQGNRSLKISVQAGGVGAGCGINAFSIIPNKLYTGCLRLYLPVGANLDVELLEVAGDGGWMDSVVPVSGNGNWQYILFSRQFWMGSYGADKAGINLVNRTPTAYDCYLDSAALVEGSAVYGNPNPTTGELEQKIRLELDGRNSAGTIVENQIVDAVISDTPTALEISKTFTNPSTALMNWRIQNSFSNPLQVYVDSIFVDDGQFYQNWDDDTYRKKLLSVNSGITIAAIRDTLSKILECEPGEIAIENNPSPKTVTITIPYGSDVTLIETLIGDMLLPGRAANIMES